MTQRFKELSPADKATTVWRGLQTLLLILTTVAVNGVWARAGRVSDQIDRQSYDIALIKHQFSTLQETTKTDKAEVFSRIDSLDKRMQLMSEGNLQRMESVNRLRTELAVIKEKIKAP